MKLAIVGATGLVGTVMLKVLEERNFPVTMLIPAASAASAGKMIEFKGQPIQVVTVEEAIQQKPDIALFSAGGSVSLLYAPLFVQQGTRVIDNSSAWRMDPKVPLVVPEVNADVISADDFIIANPNCSTIQMVVALHPLHQRYDIQRIVVSTYQSVTGTGVKAVQQMENERKGVNGPMIYPHRIDLNVLPQVDVFLENGYTKEEMKMVNETRKIMRAPQIGITATTVRIPVTGGHSESVNVTFANDFTLEEVRNLLIHQSGVELQDDPARSIYPMPMWSEGKDAVFVGRLRRDESLPKSLNMWIVSDNLRKGAATNAVQIAEYLIEKWGVGKE